MTMLLKESKILLWAVCYLWAGNTLEANRPPAEAITYYAITGKGRIGKIKVIEN